MFFLLSLPCRKLGIGNNYALFGVNLFCLKLGWCKENDIFHVWTEVTNSEIFSQATQHRCGRVIQIFVPHRFHVFIPHRFYLFIPHRFYLLIPHRFYIFITHRFYLFIPNIFYLFIPHRFYLFIPHRFYYLIPH